MRLFYYVIKDYFKYVMGSIALCVFLFVMFDFIHRTTKYFSRYKPSNLQLVQLYGYQIPVLLEQALPIASLLASVICMVLLSRTNEITAMRAAGMGPLRVGMPVAIGGFILSLVSLCIGEFVVPRTSEKMHYVQEVLIEKESDTQLTEGARWVRDGNRLINFQDYDAPTATLTNVRIIETGTNFRPKETIDAESAVYQKETKDWRLHNIKVLFFRPNGTIEYSENRATQTLAMPLEPKKLRKDRRQPNERSLKELEDFVGKGEHSGADILGYRVEMHIKFAFHFAAFVVSLIGLKFGYRSERSLETARGILMALGIGISYWFILNFGRALARREVIPPLLGAWLANVIIMSIASYEVWRVRKS